VSPFLVLWAGHHRPLRRPEVEAVIAATPTVYALSEFDRGWWEAWTKRPLPRGASARFRAGWDEGRADRAASDALPDPGEG
jgi:hypothetical protein